MKARHVVVAAARRSGIARNRVVFTIFAAALLAFTLASSAFAARPYELQLTEANGSPFVNPFGLATDPSDDLWVSDTGTGAVSKFDSSGTYLTQGSGFAGGGGGYIETLAYGSAADLLYVSDSYADDVWGVEPDGTYAGVQLNGGLGGGCCYIRVAADNSGGSNDGDLYVASGPESVPSVLRIDGAGAAKEFSADPTEEYVTANAITGTPDHAFEWGISPGAIAVAADGDLYIADPSHSEVDQYDASGTFVRAFTGPLGSSVFAVAVDPINGNVLVGEGNQVREFDSGGVFLGNVNGAATPAGSFASVQGLAFDSTGRLWVADGGHGVVDAFGGFFVVPAPLVTIDPVSDPGPYSAELSGVVTPGGNAPDFDATWRFEYALDDGSPDWIAPQALQGGPESGTDPVEVEADLAGLDPSTDYLVRLIASNAGGEAASTPQSFTTDAVPPTVGLATTTASEHGAVLRSRVNPNSQATTYRYEYGPTAAYGSTTPSLSVGSGAKAIIAAAPISGLQATSTYHYRVLATNASGTTAGPDRTVVTGEGRAYEQVSPVDKEGSDVVTDGGRIRAATDGGAIQFTSLGSFGEVRGTGISSEYMAIRSSDGWRTHAITPAHQPQARDQIVNAFDPRYAGELSDDLSTGVYVSKTPLTDDAPSVAGIKNLYLRRDLRAPGNGSYELLSDAVGEVTEPRSYQPAFADASADFSHIVFTSQLNLTPDAPPQGPYCVLAGFGCETRAYEHTPAGVRLVGKIPVAPAATCTGVGCVPAKRSAVGGKADSGVYGYGSISDDGSRIVFTVPVSSGSLVGDIYLREGDTTFQINASERTVPATPQVAHFEAASDDGSKLFFITTEPLVDSDEDNDNDAYRYDRDAPEGSRLTLLSADQEPNDGFSGVSAIYGVSTDGSYAYFSAASQLISGARLVQGDERLLFSWHDGERAFVGSVLIRDGFRNESQSFALSNRLARVTPDGSRLLFVSGSPNQPTGEQSGECDGSNPCWRAYVYDATADGGQGRLQCASCIPDGAPTASDVNYVPRVGVGGAQTEAHLNRALSEDGHYVFFSSADGLVPEDSNGRYDAYAYDTRSGQVSLLSSGACNCDSYFVDASADGSDVFFTTREQLVGWDVDKTVDLYDARIGGGFPEPASPPPTCQGDACQPPPASLDDPTPASSAFSGAGDPKPKRAKKHHAKKHHRKHKQQHHRKHRANHDRRASR